MTDWVSLLFRLILSLAMLLAPVFAYFWYHPDIREGLQDKQSARKTFGFGRAISRGEARAIWIAAISAAFLVTLAGASAIWLDPAYSSVLVWILFPLSIGFHSGTMVWIWFRSRRTEK